MKKKQNRWRMRLLSLFLLLLIGTIVFQREELWRMSKKMLGIGKIEMKAILHYDVQSTEEKPTLVKALNGYVIKVEAEKISLFNDYGVPEWEKDISSENVLVDSNEHLMVIADEVKGNIYYIDYRGNVLASTFGIGPIDQMKLRPDGLLLIALKDSNTVVLLDGQLQELNTATLPSGQLLNLDVAAYDYYFISGALLQEEESLSSTFYVYEMDGSLMSSKYFEEELLLMNFMIGDQIVTITDQEMTIFPYELSDPVHLAYEGKLMRGGKVGQYIYLITQLFEGGEAPYLFTLMDPQGQKVMMNLATETPYLGAVLGQEMIGLYNRNEVKLYDLSGSLKGSYEEASEISEIAFLSSRTLFVKGYNNFKILELIE